MRKNPGKLLLMICALAFLFTSGFARAAEYGRGQAGYLKSATYYSDDWVINFWNSESNHMDAELAQIAADGFNSIILAVPWREFQPDLAPCSYNSYAWEKLDRVMEKAAAHGLGVMLRVGYTWDYYSSENVLERYERLLYDQTAKHAWLEYAERLYTSASAHENFCGGFLTWEDFWNFTENSTRFGNSKKGREMAAASGYVDYAREHYSLEELEEMYGHSLSSYEELYFPASHSYARKVFYGFYDQFLNELLASSQQVFPDLSMEVRLDVDAVTHPDGGQEGYMHHATYSCGDSSFVSTMFSVSMGFVEEYERVTAQEALKNAPEFFNRIHVYSGGKPLYVDQFLFSDNTAGFEHNARLKEEEKAAYLEGMAPILKAMTMGYGVWTYRDYGDNKLYNAQFALGTRGWSTTGQSSVIEREGNKLLMLSPGGRISQDIKNRITGSMGADLHVRFYLEGQGNCSIVVQAGERRKTVSAGEGRIVEMEFKNCAPSDISFSCQGTGTVYMDNISVYTFVTEGDLYNLDGSKGSCLDGLRRMNQNL